jgi:hypothetical protein
MNRHEVEQRLRTVEAKIRFIMHTLALTRRDNETGASESRSLDTLFQEAFTNAMDQGNAANVAGGAFDNTPPPSGRDHQATPGPDGFPGGPVDDGNPTNTGE